ncbi:MAG TPA: FtsX-like permease family protein [Kofleriaceae bacterium]|nr:FtsX-like permease family protein [Kofleriaceae bacterium]
MDDRPASQPERRATIIAWIQIALGLFSVAAGVLITTLSFDKGESSGGDFLRGYGPIVAGAVLALRGLTHIAGYKSFIAFRYLLEPKPRVSLTFKILILCAFGLMLVFTGLYASGLGGDTGSAIFNALRGTAFLFLNVVVCIGVLRHSKPALALYLLGVFVIILAVGLVILVGMNALPFISLTMQGQRSWLQVLGIGILVGSGLAGLAAYFGSLRAFFTFFTTVPIGGVWAGTMALVVVLAVMSGFETDLREKILGSNAHIQVTREDGEFVNWREAKAKIDKIPGVVASSPYAVSEVVIAANNNGMPVIIKGIDPESVGKVTDLEKDLEDPDAMKRLRPLIDLQHDRTVEPTQKKDTGRDPMPDDMVVGGDPIDFSGGESSAPADAGAPDSDAAPAPAPDAAAPPAGSGSATTGPAGDPDTETISPYGGDAARILDVDEPPNPIEASEIIQWFTGQLDEPSSDAVPALDIVMEPSLSTRTQALPGILVGRELVKQTHLYTGEEVRVVSPLSDPSNPDATGTPIPFNRDYRVAGVFFTGMYEYDLKYVYVTLDSLQDFLDRGDAVDGIEVRIQSADDTARYVSTDAGHPGLIQEALGPGYRVQDWRELNRSLFSALKLEKIAMFLVLGIVILVASFAIVGNLIMVVVEKGREIALLKTLGATDTGIMQLFAIQGMLIGLIGTALGISMGLLTCWAIKRYGLPLDPDVYYIDRLPIHVDPTSVAAAAAAGVLISIAATLYPALLAARVRPSSGMRH